INLDQTRSSNFELPRWLLGQFAWWAELPRTLEEVDVKSFYLSVEGGRYRWGFGRRGRHRQAKIARGNAVRHLATPRPALPCPPAYPQRAAHPLAARGLGDPCP